MKKLKKYEEKLRKRLGIHKQDTAGSDTDNSIADIDAGNGSEVRHEQSSSMGSGDKGLDVEEIRREDIMLFSKKPLNRRHFCAGTIPANIQPFRGRNLIASNRSYLPHGRKVSKRYLQGDR